MFLFSLRTDHIHSAESDAGILIADKRPGQYFLYFFIIDITTNTYWCDRFKCELHISILRIAIQEMDIHYLRFPCFHRRRCKCRLPECEVFFGRQFENEISNNYPYDKYRDSTKRSLNRRSKNPIECTLHFCPERFLLCIGFDSQTQIPSHILQQRLLYSYRLMIR